MRKFRLYYDKDKEETWLDDMCRQGWEMTDFFLGVYTFRPCEPGKYTYQIDMPKLPRGADRDREKREYIAFVESTGAECVCTWGVYVVFKKETAKGAFQLYTDVESKISLYQRIRLIFFLIFLWDVWASVYNTNNFIRFADAYWTDVGLLLLVALGVTYSISLVFFCMIVRLSLKIHRLKQ